MNYPTPHIKAEPRDFAKTVLMPGDPLRAKFIAENFLTNPLLVNNVRGIQGYTGTYKGKRISVMASGMGMPSMGIYCYELFNFFEVDTILRVGSMGAMQAEVKLRDIVIALGASTNSNFMSQYSLPGSFSAIADYSTLSNAEKTAHSLGLKTVVGNILSSDTFYNADLEATSKWQKMGIIGVEMETAALYATAARARKKALGIFTVSDHILTGEELGSEARQTSFTDMISLALETALLQD